MNDCIELEYESYQIKNRKMIGTYTSYIEGSRCYIEKELSVFEIEDEIKTLKRAIKFLEEGYI